MLVYRLLYLSGTVGPESIMIINSDMILSLPNLTQE